MIKFIRRAGKIIPMRAKSTVRAVKGKSIKKTEEMVNFRDKQWKAANDKRRESYKYSDKKDYATHMDAVAKRKDKSQKRLDKLKSIRKKAVVKTAAGSAAAGGAGAGGAYAYSKNKKGKKK